MTTTATTPTTADTSAAPDGLPLTISAAAAALRDGSLTSVALTQAVQARADKLDSALGTFIGRYNETALAAAAKADEELAAGVDKGLLHGIPLGIKDIIATSDGPSTAQSLVLRPEFGQFEDGRHDALVVSRLRAAGGIITGKVTTSEYACGMPDESKGFPTPHNPFGLDYWTGGSSAGTGSGVAAGLFLGGLGTDTGGSIRIPASWCGISGMMQTFGRVPKSGCVPLGFSYDHIGPMTRSARDAAAMLAVLAGHDESDATSVDVPVPDYVAALTGTMEGLKVAVDLTSLSSPKCDPAIAELTLAAIEVFKQAGAEVTEITLPFFAELDTTAMTGLFAEALAYHQTDLQKRFLDYGRNTRKMLTSAAMITAADYVQMQRVRRVGVKAVTELFGQYDLIVNPTGIIAAPPNGALDYEGLAGTILTSYWNATGNPAMSIPMGQNALGLPAGLQIAGKPFDEATVFQAADAFQLLTDHHLAEAPTVLEMLA
ncbi:MAG: Amidase [Frankiales bacterium]|nr:Amidase [Frankiales bacterium]